MMKHAIAITAVFVLAFAGLASAQTQTQESAKPLAELAKDEEARRKSLKKPAKVYTNENLQPAGMGSSAGSKEGASGTPSASQPAAEATPSEPPATGEVRDQKYWANRMKEARAALERTQILQDSLQSRINALTNDLSATRDYPARGQVEAQRNAALAELERMKKELEAQKGAIAAIEEEARRAGVPAGWLRG